MCDYSAVGSPAAEFASSFANLCSSDSSRAGSYSVQAERLSAKASASDYCHRASGNTATGDAVYALNQNLPLSHLRQNPSNSRVSRHYEVNRE